MMKRLKVGAYVDVLPTHKNESWARNKKWPAKVTKIGFNDHRGTRFALDNSGDGWSELGLKVVNIQLENK